MKSSDKKIVDKNNEIINVNDEIISKAEIIEEKKDSERGSKLAVDYSEVKEETKPNAVVLGGMGEIGLERIDPIQIPQFLLMHPAVPRGIEIKANRLIQIPTRIEPYDDSSEAKEAAKACEEVLNNSDKKKEIFLKKIIQGAYRFGTSDSLLVTNEASNKILKMEFQHPIYFGPARDKNGKIKINPKSKLPAAFTQFKQVNVGFGDVEGYNPDMMYNVGTGDKRKTVALVPYGTEFPDSRVVSLMFDTMGDEPRGIPILQFLHKTIKNLLRIEDAGAETMVNFGFNKWVAKSNFKTKKMLEAYAASLEGIKKGSIAVLPEGCELENIVPGSTEFDRVHDIFLTLVAIRLGIPKYQLLMKGDNSNRSTAEKQSKDLFLDIFADELIVEGTINDAFEKICKYDYGDGFVKFPKFVFGKMPEDVRAGIETEMRKAVIFKNYMVAVNDLVKLGKSDMVSPILDYAMKIIYPDGVPKKEDEKGSSSDGGEFRR